MQKLIKSVPEEFKRHIALAYWSGVRDAMRNEEKPKPKFNPNIVSAEEFLSRKVKFGDDEYV